MNNFFPDFSALPGCLMSLINALFILYSLQKNKKKKKSYPWCLWAWIPQRGFLSCFWLIKRSSRLDKFHSFGRRSFYFAWIWSCFLNIFLLFLCPWDIFPLSYSFEIFHSNCHYLTASDPFLFLIHKEGKAACWERLFLLRLLKTKQMKKKKNEVHLHNTLVGLSANWIL